MANFKTSPYKRWIILVFALCITTMLNAQNAVKWEPQIYIGYNSSNISGPLDKGDIRNNNQGLNIGFSLSKVLTEGLALQPEIQLSIQGTKQTNSFFQLREGDSSEVNLTRVSKISLYYVNFPLLLQYGFSKRFKLLGGPYLGVLSGGKIENEFTEVITNSKGLISKTNRYKTESPSVKPYHGLDIGFAFGMQFRTGKNLSLSLRLARGLTDITKDKYGYGKGSDSNNTIQMMLGWGI